MLNTYLADQTTVTVTLQNKIRVSGKIKAFDSYIIVMDCPKRGIVYRHAVTCLAAYSLEKPRMPDPVSKQDTSAKNAKPPAYKPRHHPPQAALPASAGEPGINNGMKEGLLKWMREQKAAK